MLRDLVSKYYMDGNCNCSESVLRAGNEYYDLGLGEKDMIMVGAYGAGMMCGSTCGAILGAMAILSVKYIEAKAHESEDIKGITNELLDEAQKRFHSLLCSEIKPQMFEEGIRCMKTPEVVCDLLEKVIAEYDAEPVR